MEQLLIVEDSQEIRKQLKWGLGEEYEVLLAADAREAQNLFVKHRPKVVTLDLGLPPHEDSAVEGFRFLEKVMADEPSTKVIVITGYDDRDNALKAIQSGAYDYYQKPLDLKELSVIVKRAFYLHNIEFENIKLHTALLSKAHGLGDMIGQCPEMLEVFSTIRKVAPSDVYLLIVGESGTGKELVAKAIHANSLRSSGPFVPINCSAIPDSLLESELFGHEKGAFTGAHFMLQGKVEYAHKGTLFLDEIGELPANLQVKLLRFLQENVIQRVGGREDIPVDARVIAATNIDILKAMGNGAFREDLYYRLGVITIKLPPLRERKSDIMLLSTLFLRKFSKEFNKRAKGFSASSIAMLESYGWPGNVRELENRIQRAVIMSQSAIIGPVDLGFSEQQEKHGLTFQGTMTLKEARDGIERDLITSVIEKSEGNIARAAEKLGISRPTLYDLMKKHGLYNITAQGADGEKARTSHRIHRQGASQDL